MTENVEAAFGLLCRVGLQGASVTIPHKRSAARLVTEMGAAAKLADSVNTLFQSLAGTWHGENTDIPAVQALVNQRAERSLSHAAVLGTGGFARACAHALSTLKM